MLIKLHPNEDRTAAKTRSSKEDWEREYDRIKASGYSALDFIRSYLEQDVPDPAIKWTNNGFIGDLVKSVKEAAQMIRESDPKGAAAAMQGRTAKKAR